MKILLDARWIIENPTGIAVYTKELIKHFAKIPANHNFILIFKTEKLQKKIAEETEIEKDPRFNSLIVNSSPFSLKSLIVMPHIIKKTDADIFFSTHFMVPLSPPFLKRKTKFINVIHDTIPLVIRNFGYRSKTQKFFMIYKFLIKQCAKNVDMIITDSISSSCDIKKFLLRPYEAEKVKVVYCGVDINFFSPSKIELERKLNTDLKEAKILYVGRMDPYKNLRGVINVFYKLRKILNIPVKLTIIGPYDPRYPEVKIEAEKLGIGDSIEWTGYVDKQELLNYYRISDVLLNLSFYEGFGLQVLEAMACGTAVVCSNRGSLPEITGLSAILVDPENHEEAANKTAEIITNKNIRKKFILSGLEHVKKFTWVKCAEEIIKLFESFNLNSKSWKTF